MKGKPACLQARPRLHEGRARCIVDGDADGALRERPAGIECGKDFGNRQHGVAAAHEVLDVRLELVERHARGRVRVLAEAVVLQDHRGVGGDGRTAAAPYRDGYGESEPSGAAAAEEPAESHEAINSVPAAESQSRG